jgi:hypothetical protein
MKIHFFDIPDDCRTELRENVASWKDRTKSYGLLPAEWALTGKSKLICEVDETFFNMFPKWKSFNVSIVEKLYPKNVAD